MSNQPLTLLALTPLDPATANNWGGTLETVVNNTITEVNDHETRIQGVEAGGGGGALSVVDNGDGTGTVTSGSGGGTTGGAALTDNGNGTFNLSTATTIEVAYTKATTDTLLGGKAATASPTFTGHVTVPTPTTSTDAATKAYVDAAGGGSGGGGGALSVVDNGDGTGTVVDGTMTTNSQTGTAYTVVLADAGNVVEQNSTNTLTITIPTNASAPIPVGSAIEFRLYGTGSITLAGASGVTLLSPAGLRLTTRYASAAIVKRGLNEWIVSGYTVA